MAERGSVRHLEAGASAGSEVVQCRYALAIGGVHIRTVSGAVAQATFQRWRDQPDVLVFGTLRTGFYWQWPDKYRTKITLIPIVKKSAADTVLRAARDTSQMPQSEKGRR